MCEMRNNQPPGGTIDLWTGEVIDDAKGERRQLKPWPERHRVIATELYLAETVRKQHLHLFEMVVVWPQWLEKASRLADIRRYWDALRWNIDAALNPYGWQVPKCGRKEPCYRIAPIEGAQARALRSVGAVDDLLRAGEALLQKNHELALICAREALTYCPGSVAAWTIAGACLFRHGLSEGDSFVFQAADYLLRYERNLRHAVDGLSSLCRQEKSAQSARFASAQEFIRRHEETLTLNSDVFDAARWTLQQAISQEELWDVPSREV